LMICNEQGKLMRLEFNPVATCLLVRSIGLNRDVIVGPVVMVGMVDDEGDILGLSDDLLATLKRDIDRAHATGLVKSVAKDRFAAWHLREFGYE